MAEAKQKGTAPAVWMTPFLIFDRGTVQEGGGLTLAKGGNENLVTELKRGAGVGKTRLEGVKRQRGKTHENALVRDCRKRSKKMGLPRRKAVITNQGAFVCVGGGGLPIKSDCLFRKKKWKLVAFVVKGRTRTECHIGGAP